MFSTRYVLKRLPQKQQSRSSHMNYRVNYIKGYRRPAFSIKTDWWLTERFPIKYPRSTVTTIFCARKLFWLNNNDTMWLSSKEKNKTRSKHGMLPEVRYQICMIIMGIVNSKNIFCLKRKHEYLPSTLLVAHKLNMNCSQSLYDWFKSLIWASLSHYNCDSHP